MEAYADRAALAGLGGDAAAGVITRDARMVLTATAIALAKPARMGREAFAARLGHDLAHGGVLAMDGDAWRRLDRVDAVVLDADLLATGRAVLGAVWVAPAIAGRPNRRGWPHETCSTRPTRPRWPNVTAGCSPRTGLVGACHVLQAVPEARAMSRRAVMIAEYGGARRPAATGRHPRRPAARRT